MPVIGSISHSSPLDGWYLYSPGRLMLDLKNHPHLEPTGMDVAFLGRACYYSYQENYLAWWFCPSLSYLLQPGWWTPPKILAQVADLISYSEPPGCLFERLVDWFYSASVSSSLIACTPQPPQRWHMRKPQLLLCGSQLSPTYCNHWRSLPDGLRSG